MAPEASEALPQDPLPPPVSSSPIPSPEPQSPPVEKNHPEDFQDLSKVPECYWDLKQVFNKAKATSLPPHTPFDCAIDLLPGSTPPRGCLYSLSVPEREAMQYYIDSALAAGIIRPSSSPAGAGFFFVERETNR